MNANDLLKQFEHISKSDLYQIRDSPDLDSLPADQTTYFTIVNEVFPHTLTDDLLTDAAFDKRQRVTNILGEFLIRDGRAFNAIVAIASRASNEENVYNSNSVNALAHLHVYLVHRRGQIPITDDELISQLRDLCEIEDTHHNATGLTEFLNGKGDR